MQKRAKHRFSTSVIWVSMEPIQLHQLYLCADVLCLSDPEILEMDGGCHVKPLHWQLKQGGCRELSRLTLHALSPQS